MNIFNVIRVILWIFAIILWCNLLSEINISFYAEKYSNLIPILAAVLTGLITWAAMSFIDNQAKKRWMNEGYQKRRIELEIEIKRILSNIKDSINSNVSVYFNMPEQTKQDYIKLNSLIEEYSHFNKKILNFNLDSLNFCLGHQCLTSDQEAEVKKKNCLNTINNIIEFINNEMKK